MAKFIGSIEQHPARVSVAWYAATIAIGAVLLAQPVSFRDGQRPITALDAAFTATSATCVTGLTVRSTGQDFSWFGQVVILTLIQVGGIGIMTVTTYLTLRLGGRQGLRQRAVITETLGAGENVDVRWVLGRVLRLTLLLESVGTLVLFVRFLFDYRPGLALWHAFFHTVSAFCNAGFGLHDDSLIRYQGDWVVNLAVPLLIITGGLGFPVLIDISRHWHHRWRDCWDALLLHSKLMLAGSAVLLVFGAGMFLLLERDGVLREMSLPRRLLVAWFHSATCRTAGFNTIEVGQLTSAALFLSILLMAVGAGACSTAGGFKVSTLTVLVLRVWNSFLGRRQIHVVRRTIPEAAVARAIAAAGGFTALAVVALMTLLVMEPTDHPYAVTAGDFMDKAFEVVSALGTVGLSTGITPHLSAGGQMAIILLMFVGRLGPITAFIALSRGQRKQAIEYAHEEPLIG
ncbi:MAG: Trk family potassium uptake protein [Candidatus Anammoximicrobium sp.]|nr:Trk family potassium uptake protein [Candidatus Anammoximicrobium sp.]